MDLFSSLMVMSECLLDNKRTSLFKRAIEKVVKPGDLVLDIGTGSGVLSLFAARAGARRVLAFEISKEVSKMTANNVKVNRFSDAVKVMNQDAMKATLSNSADVVIMEMLDTCLIAEQQAPVINKLIVSGVINDSTIVIPSLFYSAFDLISYDFNFFGLEMPFMIQARNYSTNKRVTKKLSRMTVFDVINFKQKSPLLVSKLVVVSVDADGVLNALRLQSKVELCNGISTWGTTDMNIPVIVPLQPRSVMKGDKVSLKINYIKGEGFGKFSATLLGTS